MLMTQHNRPWSLLTKRYLLLMHGWMNLLFMKDTPSISNAAPNSSQQQVDSKQPHQFRWIHSFRGSGTKDEAVSSFHLEASHTQFTGLQVWRPLWSSTSAGAMPITAPRRGIRAQPTQGRGPLCSPLIPHSPPLCSPLPPAMTAWLTIGHTMGGRMPPPGHERLPPTCTT